MTARNHLIFWTGMFAAFAALVWLFGDVLTPFVLGAILAYLLEPLVRRLQGRGVRRKWAALLITCVFTLVLVVLGAVLVPVLYREGVQLAKDIPSLIDQLMALSRPYTGWIQDRLGYRDSEDIGKAIQNGAGPALKAGSKVLDTVAAGGQAIITAATYTVLTPIVAFFMMKEWPAMTGWVRSIMPEHQKETILDLFRQINGKLSGFIRGQLSVCVVLGGFYAIALTIAGLKYGFLIGIGAGILSVIPLVGSTLGLFTGVTVAWFQTGEWSFVAIVAGIFLFGQLMEGNFITPKLVGDSVGLHPLWIMFALMAGGALLGIVGMLLAVPVAAVVGVLASFVIRRYKSSAYYTGEDGSKK